MEKQESLTVEDKRKLAEKRAAELKQRIEPYLKARENIPTGMKLIEKQQKQKQKILDLLGATEDDWKDWRWQLKNRFTTVEQLGKILNLTDREKQEIEEVGRKYRWAISPYYVSLMDPDDPNCPVRRQAVPAIQELQDVMGEDDPMGEEFTSPVPSITRRYPDRLIIKVTNQCAMYCRHCQRRRNIGEVDKATPKEQLEQALDYVRKHPEIRDVLLTGGDAFMLSEERLDWLLGELDKIEHVEIKRLGSRTPVTMPQRITPELCEVLAKHHPVYVNTHFNTPKEVTPEAAEACDRLTRAGVPLGNQAVLLKGINNDPHVMKKLNHELLKIRVRPYYIFHAKPVSGTTHFITRVEEGIDIMEQLRGQTSGLAIPTYIINAPHGYGKTPMLPEYLISSGKDFITIRTWEGRVMKYPNKDEMEQ
ncbi:MAG: glutamate 2,3-aminomutase [Thermoanaerobacteraceae bacterium]|nr:glutamate 2,3-aminomutase [Thermoanaerobacteraceae bacterium]